MDASCGWTDLLGSLKQEVIGAINIDQHLTIRDCPREQNAQNCNGNKKDLITTAILSSTG